MKLINKFQPGGHIQTTIALPEVEVKPNYPRLPKESDYISEEEMRQAFSTPQEYIDAAAIRPLQNLYHTDYGRFKQEWERMYPNSTAEGRQATKDQQDLSTMMQHRNQTMDKWKIPMTALVAGPAISPFLGASSALAESYPLVAAGLKGATNLFFAKTAVDHALSDNGFAKTKKAFKQDPWNVFGEAKAWMPITDSNFSTQGGLLDPNANRGWGGSALGDVADVLFTGQVFNKARQGIRAYSTGQAQQMARPGILPAEISAKHNIPSEGLAWPEGYSPIEGYYPVRYLTNPDGSIRNVQLWGGGKYKLYNDLTGTAKRSTKFQDLVSNQAIERYNPALLKDRPEFIQELQRVAKEMDEGRMPEPLIDSEFDFYPEIWKVVLNTQKGKKTFPYGARIIGRGEHPGSPLAVDSPGYPGEGIFTGMQPTLTLPYMETGVRIVEEGDNAFNAAAKFEDYARVVGDDKARRIVEIDKELTDLTRKQDFYTDFNTSRQVQKLNNERRELLGQHPEFGGHDLFILPYSNKNRGFYGNRTPKINDMGMEVGEDGVLRHNWTGPSYDPAHPELVTTTNAYGKQLDSMQADDFLSVLLRGMHDIGYGDEFITRKGYPFRSMFSSNFDLDNFTEWNMPRYVKGGRLINRNLFKQRTR